MISAISIEYRGSKSFMFHIPFGSFSAISLEISVSVLLFARLALMHALVKSKDLGCGWWKHEYIPLIVRTWGFFLTGTVGENPTERTWGNTSTTTCEN